MKYSLKHLKHKIDCMNKIIDIHSNLISFNDECKNEFLDNIKLLSVISYEKLDMINYNENYNILIYMKMLYNQINELLDEYDYYIIYDLKKDKLVIKQ